MSGQKHEADTGTDATSDPHVDEAFRCEACDRRWYYTRARCPDCGADTPSTYELGEGTVVTWTEVHVTPADVRSPNRLGLVRFDEVQLVAQLDDEVSVGDVVTFAGAHRLRDGDGAESPRLVPVNAGRR